MCVHVCLSGIGALIINNFYNFQVFLPKPRLCQTEIYELMCECWKRDPNLRPSFKEMYKFLKSKNLCAVAGTLEC